MSGPVYRPLSRGEVELLLAPENRDLELAWTYLRGQLHGVVAMLSITHPRPLYHYEENARRVLAEWPERLRGSRFYEKAIANVRAAEEVERMFREHGHNPELHDVVDAYLDALLDEFDEMRLYPEIPPRHGADEENGAGRHRAVAGR